MHRSPYDPVDPRWHAGVGHPYSECHDCDLDHQRFIRRERIPQWQIPLRSMALRVVLVVIFISIVSWQIAELILDWIG